MWNQAEEVEPLSTSYGFATLLYTKNKRKNKKNIYLYKKDNEKVNNHCIISLPRLQIDTNHPFNMIMFVKPRKISKLPKRAHSLWQ